MFVSSKDECFKCGEQTQCRIVLQSKSRCENGNAGDFVCLLDDDGFKHIDIQIRRHSERYGRTPGFKDSNFNDKNRDNEFSKTETTKRNTGLIRRKTELDSD